jgi:hypothetical protein
MVGKWGAAIVLAIAITNRGAMGQPANDMFADAQTLVLNDKGYGAETLIITEGATREAGEAAIGSDDRTIWYRWVAPASGSFKVSVGSPIAFSAVVYRLVGAPTFANLVQITSHSGNSVLYKYFEPFKVGSGDTIYIRGGHPNGVEGLQFLDVIGQFMPEEEILPDPFSTVAFSRTPAVLGRRNTLSGIVGNPADVAAIEVRGLGAGRASAVTYNPATGALSFVHKRVGQTKPGKVRRVTYTVTAIYTDGSAGNSASRSFKVR